MRAAELVPLVESPPPAGQQSQAQGMEFKEERVDALVRLPGGDVAVPAGLGAAHGRPPRSPPGEEVGFKSLRRSGRSRRRGLAVWLGIVVVLRCLSLIQLNR